jgi:hypothetical protein
VLLLLQGMLRVCLRHSLSLFLRRCCWPPLVRHAAYGSVVLSALLSQTASSGWGLPADSGML